MKKFGGQQNNARILRKVTEKSLLLCHYLVLDVTFQEYYTELAPSYGLLNTRLCFKNVS